MTSFSCQEVFFLLLLFFFSSFYNKHVRELELGLCRSVGPGNRLSSKMRPRVAAKARPYH